MDIYKYRKEVLKRLDQISDKEFYEILLKAGVNCKPKKEG